MCICCAVYGPYFTNGSGHIPARMERSPPDIGGSLSIPHPLHFPHQASEQQAVGEPDEARAQLTSLLYPTSARVAHICAAASLTRNTHPSRHVFFGFGVLAQHASFAFPIRSNFLLVTPRYCLYVHPIVCPVCLSSSRLLFACSRSLPPNIF